jgi:hypothetical protein
LLNFIEPNIDSALLEFQVLGDTLLLGVVIEETLCLVLLVTHNIINAELRFTYQDVTSEINLICIIAAQLQFLLFPSDVEDRYFDDQSLEVYSLEHEGLQEDRLVFTDDNLASRLLLPYELLRMVFKLSLPDELRHSLGPQSTTLFNVEDCEGVWVGEKCHTGKISTRNGELNGSHILSLHCLYLMLRGYVNLCFLLFL